MSMVAGCCASIDAVVAAVMVVPAEPSAADAGCGATRATAAASASDSNTPRMISPPELHGAALCAGVQTGISNLDVLNGHHATRAAPIVPTFSSCSVHPYYPKIQSCPDCEGRGG